MSTPERKGGKGEWQHIVKNNFNYLRQPSLGSRKHEEQFNNVRMETFAIKHENGNRVERVCLVFVFITMQELHDEENYVRKFLIKCFSINKKL